MSLFFFGVCYFLVLNYFCGSNILRPFWSPHRTLLFYSLNESPIFVFGVNSYSFVSKSIGGILLQAGDTFHGTLNLHPTIFHLLHVCNIFMNCTTIFDLSSRVQSIYRIYQSTPSLYYYHSYRWDSVPCHVGSTVGWYLYCEEYYRYTVLVQVFRF